MSLVVTSAFIWLGGSVGSLCLDLLVVARCLDLLVLGAWICWYLVSASAGSWCLELLVLSAWIYW